MARSRRDFIRSATGTVFGLTAVGSVSALSTAERYRWRETLAGTQDLIGSESKSDHDVDEGRRIHSPRHVFGTSHVRLLEVFETNTYGWEAYVGLGGCAQCLIHYGDENWGTSNSFDSTSFDVINGDESYHSPSIDSGYRGFAPTGSDSDINIPDWLQPTFETGVSVLISFASSNPWTGAGSAVVLNADDILDGLEGDDGRSSIDGGYRVEHSTGWSGIPSELSHYQRINPRFGDLEFGWDLEVKSRFTADGVGWPSDDIVVENSFRIYVWEPDDGTVLSDGETTSPENWSTEQKQEVGYLEVSGGEPVNPVAQSDPVITRRIQQLDASIGDRELTSVMLNPPSRIE